MKVSFSFSVPMLALGLGSLAFGVVSSVRPPLQAKPRQKIDFNRDIRPILANNCLKCHGGEAKIKGGLRLTSRAELLKGGDTGAAIDPASAFR